jgi:hypothetical protein
MNDEDATTNMLSVADKLTEDFHQLMTMCFAEETKGNPAQKYAALSTTLICFIMNNIFLIADQSAKDSLSVLNDVIKAMKNAHAHTEAMMRRTERA